MNDSVFSSNQDTEIDSINSYFECITECSIVDGHQECITRCVEVHLKGGAVSYTHLTLPTTVRV